MLNSSFQKPARSAPLGVNTGSEHQPTGTVVDCPPESAEGASTLCSSRTSDV